jgi:Cu(I)-responsive transcriptional regulator
MNSLSINLTSTVTIGSRGKMIMSEITIGKVAKITGCKVQTIRYYEQIGLLPEPARSEGNQRLYNQDTVKRLTFIRHARDLGFSLQVVRNLLDLTDDPEKPCDEATEIVISQLEHIDKRIRQLTSLKEEMRRMLNSCKGGVVSDCRIIEVLYDHSLCETQHRED